jgi:hypothetical protein
MVPIKEFELLVESQHSYVPWSLYPAKEEFRQDTKM